MLNFSNSYLPCSSHHYLLLLPHFSICQRTHSSSFHYFFFFFFPFPSFSVHPRCSFYAHLRRLPPLSLCAVPATAGRWISASPALSSDRKEVRFPPTNLRVCWLRRNIHGVAGFKPSSSAYIVLCKTMQSSPARRLWELDLFSPMLELSWPTGGAPLNCVPPFDMIILHVQ